MSNEKVFFQKHRKVCVALCIIAVVQLLLIAGSLPNLLEEFKSSFDKVLCYKAEEPPQGHPVPWMLAIPVPLLMLAWIWGLWLCVRSFLSLIRHRKDRSAATTVVLGGLLLLFFAFVLGIGFVFQDILILTSMAMMLYIYIAPVLLSVIFLVFLCIVLGYEWKNKIKMTWVRWTSCILLVASLLINALWLVPSLRSYPYITTPDFVQEQRESATATLGITVDQTEYCYLYYDYRKQEKCDIGSHIVEVEVRDDGSCERYQVDTENQFVYYIGLSGELREILEDAIRSWCERNSKAAEYRVTSLDLWVDILSHNDPDADICAGEEVLISLYSSPRVPRIPAETEEDGTVSTVGKFCPENAKVKDAKLFMQSDTPKEWDLEAANALFCLYPELTSVEISYTQGDISHMKVVH